MSRSFLLANDTEASLALDLLNFLSVANTGNEANDHRPLIPMILTAVSIGIIIMKEGILKVADDVTFQL